MHVIRIRSDDGGFRFHRVTKNLLVASQTLRHQSKPQILWIDAICINQEDLTGKNQQVPLMPNIHRKANKVCAWLSTEDKNSSLASGLTNKMRILKDFDYLVEAKTNCEEWESFTSLLNRRWFSRCWVVQEIIFARCATTYYGKTIIGRWDFCEAASLFESIVNRVEAKFKKDSNLDQHPDRFVIVR